MYLPADEINDSRLVVRGIIGLKFDYLVVVSRNSRGWSPPEQENEDRKSKLIGKRFLEAVCKLPADHAERLSNDVTKTTHLLMDSSSNPSRSGFKHITSTKDSPSFRRFTQRILERLNGKAILFLIRGPDGFITRRDLLRELYDSATARNQKFHFCFYLDTIAKFSDEWALSDVARLGDAAPSEPLQYLHRRFNALARAREAPGSEFWVREDQRAWSKEYAKHAKDDRNAIERLSGAISGPNQTFAQSIAAAQSSVAIPTQQVSIPRALPTPVKNKTACSCEKCGATFTRYSDLDRHMDTKHGNTEYNCLTCDYTNVREDKTRAHCRDKHGDAKGSEQYSARQRTNRS